jgi:hypothetical protein
LAPCGMGKISSMNMRERGLIGTRPLLFVVKVKRPRFEVHRKAFSDLGGGKAVRVRLGMARSGDVCCGGHGTAGRG